MTQTFSRTLIILLSLFFSVSYSAIAHFGSKGPFGGSVSTLLVYDSTVYVGTFTGGVYISANTRLLNWTPRPVGLKSGSITALAHTGTYLFAATADSGIFIFNSQASDKYWVRKNKWLTNLKVTSLLALDSITLLAGTNGGGIFKTTDKGNNWVAINNPTLHHLEITGLIKSGNRIIHSAEDGGLYASDDTGASWIDYNNENTDDVGGTNLISFNPTTQGLLVLNKNGLFKGTVTTNTTPPSYAFADKGLPENINISGISNDGTNWYLASDQGVFVSPADNISWTKINTGLTTPNVTAVVPFKDKLVSGTYKEGIFTAAKTFSTWTASNTGFNNFATYSIATKDLIVVAATEKGLFISKDLAATYVQANHGLIDSLNINDVAFASDWIIAGTKRQGIFYSADTGKNWIPYNGGLAIKNISKVYQLNQSNYAIDSTGVLYSSAKGSTTWKSEQNDLPAGAKVTSVTMYGQKLLVSTKESGTFIKSIASDKWIPSSTGLNILDVTSVTAQGNKIFAGTNGNGIYVSDTTAISWKKVTGTPTSEHTTLVDNSFNSNFIQALSSNDGYLYASYKGGLFASSDYGVTWIPGGNQFNLPTYSSIKKISFAKGRVFVTTENNSLYSNALSELPAITGVWDVDLTKGGLLNISPNPNAGRFSLNSEIPVSEISIYDYSGKLLSTLKDNFQDINVNQTSGLYFIKATTSNGLIVQKFLIQ